MFKVTVEDLTNVGGPIHMQQTNIIDEVYFHHIENAKDWCLENYKRDFWNEDAVIEWQYNDDGTITSVDLLDVMYIIEEIETQDEM